MRTCRTCHRQFRPVGRDAYCSKACRCGTDAGYGAGCRCDGCREAHSERHHLRRAAPRPDVPVIGVRRRVQALARLGWSTAELSRLLGRHRSYILKVLRSTTVEQDTAAAISDLYERLCMTWCTSITASRTAADARRRGWVPPLGWDEGAIDDPEARPAVRVSGCELDEVAVQRVLSGDWRTPTTREEKAEVAARWAASGRPLAELGRLTGWKIERYA